jgi:hypothetical protein
MLTGPCAASFWDERPRQQAGKLDNLAPADVYFGRGRRIIALRKENQRKTSSNGAASTTKPRHKPEPNEPDSP